MAEEKEIQEAKSLQVRHAGVILADGCPWAEAAERLAMMLGRPAATIAVLLSRQLDLYTHSPQDEAHKAHDKELSQWSQNQAQLIDDLTSEQILSMSIPPPISPSEIQAREEIDPNRYVSAQNAVYETLQYFIDRLNAEWNSFSYDLHRGRYVGMWCRYQVRGQCIGYWSQSSYPGYVYLRKDSTFALFNSAMGRAKNDADTRFNGIKNIYSDVFKAYSGLTTLYTYSRDLIWDLYIRKFSAILNEWVEPHKFYPAQHP